MPKFEMKNVKATDIVGKIVVIEIPEKSTEDSKTGEVTWNVIVVFEGEKRNPTTIKLTKKPENIEEYDSVEFYGLAIDCWGQASGNFANINWRGTAFEMVKVGQSASKAFLATKQATPTTQATTGATATTTPKNT